MSDSFFKFEREGVDFPFYKGNPKLSKLGWISLLISVLLPAFHSFVYRTIICDYLYLPGWVLYICFWILPLLIVLGVCRSHLSLLFKKLTKNDILLILILLFLSITVVGIFDRWVDILLPLPSDNYGSPFTFICGSFECLFLDNLAFSMLHEELLKFALFILLLALTYKLSGDRKISIVCASVVTLVMFGAYHFGGVGGWMRIVSDILTRGLGSIFEFYGYLKTKNILVSYFIHLLYDIIPFDIISF